MALASCRAQLKADIPYAGTQAADQAVSLLPTVSATATHRRVALLLRRAPVKAQSKLSLLESLCKLYGVAEDG
ncbi:hypothetical protein BK667_23575 [Pseudomonas frederiksbergensis]|nr:hypothetical protein BK667_23575 [Pseudomonas frederiksbergensis]